VDSLFHTCSFTADQNFVVQYCSGIAETENAVASIYPNPSGDEVTIEFAEGLASKNFYLVNVLGETVYQQTNFADEKITLDAGRFAPGIYFAKISSRGRTAIHKIIFY
jgi:hypothetical protein